MIDRPPREEDEDSDTSSSEDEGGEGGAAAADAGAREGEVAAAANAGGERRRGGGEPAPEPGRRKLNSSGSSAAATSGGGGEKRHQFTHALITGPRRSASGDGRRGGGGGSADDSASSRKRPAAGPAGASGDSARGTKRARTGRSVPLFASRLLVDHSGDAPALLVERPGRPARPARTRRDHERSNSRTGEDNEGRPQKRCAHCRSPTTRYRVCNFWNVTGNKCGRAYCSDCLLEHWTIGRDVRCMFNPNGTEWSRLVEDAKYDAEWHCPPCLDRVAREEVERVAGEGLKRKSSRRRGV